MAELDEITVAVDALSAAAGELTDYFSDRQAEFKAREEQRTADFEKEMAELDAQIADQEAEMAGRAEDLAEQRRNLEDEITALNGTHKFTKQKIKLDVGGTRFTTSKTTLLTEPNSFLAAMLSGRYELTPDPQDGSYFIDRDGQHFKHIVNFLRGPDAFECPTDPAVLEILKEDAIYYKMDEFLKVVEAQLAKSTATKQSIGNSNNSHYQSATEATWNDANAARNRPQYAPSAGGNGGQWNTALR